MNESRNPPTPPNGTTLSDRVRSLRLGGRTEGSKSGAGVLPWALCVILLGMTTAFGYRAYRVGPAPAPADASVTAEGPARPGGSPSTGSTELPTTSVANVGEVVLQSKGYVVPISLIQVSPKVGGQLIKIDPNFEEGRTFKENDVLAELEDVDYRADHDQALYAYEAATQRAKELEGYRPEEIQQARAELDESERNAQQLKLDLERNKRLMMGTIAQKDYEQSKYTYEAMDARVKRLRNAVKLMVDGPREEKRLAAQADMKAAEAALRRARWRLENTKIRAPVTGIILTKKAQKGNIVNPSAFSSGISASLCDMADLRKVEIDLSVQERDVAGVREWQKCLIMPEAYQADKGFLEKHPQGYVGYVSRLMPMADRAKGAIPVRVRIPEEAIPLEEAGKYLRPEMVALVSFTRETFPRPK